MPIKGLVNANRILAKRETSTFQNRENVMQRRHIKCFTAWRVSKLDRRYPQKTGQDCIKKDTDL